MNSVEWNPKHNLLAYAGDDKNKYQADEGKLSFLFNVILLTRFQKFDLYFLVAGIFRIFGFESA